MRVLVVEDDQWVREVICEILQDSNIETIAVATPDEAAAMLSDASCDMVLSDVHLPGRLGWLDVVDRAAGLGVPCILMSGDFEVGPMLAPTGIPFLAKPFMPSVLLTAIEKHVAHRLAA